MTHAPSLQVSEQRLAPRSQDAVLAGALGGVTCHAPADSRIWSMGDLDST